MQRIKHKQVLRERKETNVGKRDWTESSRKRVEQSFPSSSRPSMIAFKCLAISLGSRKDGQTVDMFYEPGTSFLWIPGKNNCREFESRRFFPEIKCSAATKATVEIGSEIESRLSQILNAKMSASNGLLPAQQCVWLAKCKWKVDIGESIGYFHFHFENSFFGCCHCRSVLSYSQSFAEAAAVPRHTTFELHGSYCHTVDISIWAGQLVLHLHCTVQEPIYKR